MRQQDANRFIDSVRSAYAKIGKAPIRCAFGNEDTPHCCPLTALCLANGWLESCASEEPILRAIDERYGHTFALSFLEGFDGGPLRESLHHYAWQLGRWTALAIEPEDVIGLPASTTK
jgi:hypothetical protein